MSLIKIVSDVERVGKSPAGRPALRLCDLVAESVLRRFGRRLTQLYRAVDWGDDPRPRWQRINWPLIVFLTGWTAFMAAAAYVGAVR